jgi:hypothetical protein
MADGTDLKTNGSSKGTYTPDGFAAGSTLRPKGSPGDAKELIETNDKDRNVLMKYDLENPGEATKAGMAIYWCRDHIGENSDEEDLVKDILALRCSVKAKRIQVLLQGITGILLGHQQNPQNLERFKKESGNGN